MSRGEVREGFEGTDLARWKEWERDFFVIPNLCHGHPEQAFGSSNQVKAKRTLLSFSFFVHSSSLMKASFQRCLLYTKKVEIDISTHFCFHSVSRVLRLRRERDSNPRNLSVQRFSRPPQSTTLPSLLRRNWLARKKLALRVWLAAVAPLNSGSRSPRYIFLGWFFQIGCKSTAFFSNIQIFGENSCQYAKNIVILQQICTKFIQKCCYKY